MTGRTPISYIGKPPILFPVADGSGDALLGLSPSPRNGQAAPDVIYRLDRIAIEALAEGIKRYRQDTTGRYATIGTDRD